MGSRVLKGYRTMGRVWAGKAVKGCRTLEWLGWVGRDLEGRGCMEASRKGRRGLSKSENMERVWAALGWDCEGPHRL